MENYLFGAVSATFQGVLTAAVLYAVATEKQVNYVLAALTWGYVFALASHTETYDRLVRRGGKMWWEITKRTLIALPLLYGVNVSEHGAGSLSYVMTHVTILLISIGDKFASAVYSYIPRLRDQFRLSEGYYRFLWIIPI